MINQVEKAKVIICDCSVGVEGAEERVSVGVKKNMASQVVHERRKEKDAACRSIAAGEMNTV